MNEKPASAPSVPAAAPIDYRPAAASDVDAIYNLILEAARTTTVLPRPRQAIQASLKLFVVAARSGLIVGCGALTLFTPQLAEVRSLVVSPDLRGCGVGGGVVRALVEHADRIGVRRVFALTDSPGFFLRHGFTLTNKDTLPHKVWNECVHCPKFLTCTEEAVDLHLSPDAANDPALRTLEGHTPTGGPGGSNAGNGNGSAGPGKGRP
jgi:amino-acid N-acetyltransferase